MIPRMVKRYGITVILFCLALSGCTTSPVTFKTLSDQSYDTSNGRTITASACDLQLLIFIPIRIKGHLEETYDMGFRQFSDDWGRVKTRSRLEDVHEELMAKAGTHALVDIKIQESWYYAYLGTIYCTDLEATAYPKLSVSHRSITQYGSP